MRLAAAMLAEEHGFQVHEATDADEAIAILKQEVGIGIVFTDIQMVGNMDGLALAAYAHDGPHSSSLSYPVTICHAPRTCRMAPNFSPSPTMNGL
ncbi:hypothetical protein GCM10023219_29920 [Stakelama sediminis]